MPRECGNCGPLSAALLLPALVLVATEITTPDGAAPTGFETGGARLPGLSVGSAFVSSAGLVLGLSGLEGIGVQQGARLGLRRSLPLLHGVLLVASVVRLLR